MLEIGDANERKAAEWFTQQIAALEEKARESDAQHRKFADSLFKIVPGAIVQVGSDGSILRANDEALAALGLSYDAITARYVSDWNPETINEDGSACSAEDYPASQALATGEPQGPQVIGVRRPDGSVMWGIFRANPMRDANGNVESVIVSIADITREKEMLARVRQQEADMRSLVANMPYYLATFEPEGKIVFTNRTASSTTVEEVLTKTVYDFFAPEIHDMIRESFARMPETGETLKFENRLDLNGEVIYLQNTMWPVERGGKKLIDSISVDVTESKKLAHELEFRANHDSLTGLANRYRFEAVAAEAIESARSDGRTHAFVYVDLDQFKIVNDTCGHIAGDELLCQLAKIMTEALPDASLIARLGGDEFGIILYDCTTAQAVTIMNVFRHRIEFFRFSWEGHAFHVGVSIGLVPITRQAGEYSQLLRNADLACYAAKNQGRNHIVVHDETQAVGQSGNSDMDWINAVTSALEEDRIVLFAQKIFATEGDAQLRFEVLVRMRDVQGQLVAPGIFIPALERFDIIARLDEWVLEHTIRWLEDHAEIAAKLDYCSVNISGKSVNSKRFRTACRILLRKMTIPTSKIRLELTETAAVTNMDLLAHFLSELDELGVSMVLDDFGAGLASFSLLRGLKFSAIKIDGSFVRQAVGNHIDALILKSMHDLADAMGITTVAEFVESEEILQMIRGIGIGYAQGYHLHRPEPLADLMA